MSQITPHLDTLLERLIRSLGEAARHQPGEVAPPAAVLWTDADGQWRPLVPALRARMPHFIVLGSYDPTAHTGPAIWLKSVIAGALAEPKMPAGVVPVIYLPEISRQALRAGEECPIELQPLVELQYRGALWTQRNGKDWTVEAFLVSDDGLGLDVAKDQRTRQSMLGALAILAETPVSRLANRRLEAEDFDLLLVGDPVRDILIWMNDPEGTRRAWDSDRWKAFRSRCRDTYGFDPESDGSVVAGEKFACRESPAWYGLWDRFAEAPANYPGIPPLLVRSKPTRLVFNRETWPDENDKAEGRLREQLIALENTPAPEACQQVIELEKEHGPRRRWVWAKLDRCTLAIALEHLARLAIRCRTALRGDTPEEMSRLYAEGGYLADDAVLSALAAVSTVADVRAVTAAVRAIYSPWLEASAEHFQALIAKLPLPSGTQEEVVAKAGECILFADGLRFDLAQRLAASLESRSSHVEQKSRWAALPTVTSTAKPQVSPVADLIAARELPEDFCPEVAATKQTLTVPRFRKMLTDRGYAVLSADETGDPGEPEARAWTECGQIDARGHDLGVDLAGLVATEVERLCDRIVELLDAGWRSVRIVTDHGWLLMPGGLPKHDLPPYLVNSKWARCATVKGSSRVNVPTAPWHWNPATVFAAAPGISCFANGNAYAHGGLSLQECLVPDLTVSSQKKAEVLAARVTDVQWLGLRCRVTIEPSDDRLRVDVRTKPNVPDSTIAASPKPVDSEGRASLMVSDEELAGTAAVIVVVDPTGQVLVRQPTTVGGQE